MFGQAQRKVHETFTAREIEFKFQPGSKCLYTDDELGQGARGSNLVEEHGSRSSSKSLKPGRLVQV